MTPGSAARLGAGLALLLALTASGPALAGSLVTSPGIIELAVLPGTTARAVLSVENGLDRTCTVAFSPVSPKTLEAGYVNLPRSSWLTLDTAITQVPPDERAWTVAEITVPDDEGLRGQKWQIEIVAVCQEEPLLKGAYTILVTVGGADRQRTSWWTAGGIIAAALAGAIAWGRWRTARRSAWPTGLKAGDWR